MTRKHRRDKGKRSGKIIFNFFLKKFDIEKRHWYKARMNGGEWFPAE